MSPAIRFRPLVLLMASLALCLSGLASAQEGWRGVSTDDWQGYKVLTGGKGYVDALLGQLHYRDTGPREDRQPIILLHQSPMSMIQWAAVQNALAARGIRSITVDSPGYGMSDAPATQPSIEDYADNLIALLDALELEKVVVGGHHTGAQVAVSLAARHGERVQALVLHGSALLTKEEAETYLKSDLFPPRTPLPDGSHFAKRYQRANYTRQELLDALTWSVIGAYIQGPDIGHYAAFKYDMMPDIPKIKVPVLLLTDTSDPVHVTDERLHEMRPDFDYLVFSEGDLFEFMTKPERWADIYSAWRERVLKAGAAQAGAAAKSDPGS